MLLWDVEVIANTLVELGDGNDNLILSGATSVNFLSVDGGLGVDTLATLPPGPFSVTSIEDNAITGPELVDFLMAVFDELDEGGIPWEWLT